MTDSGQFRPEMEASWDLVDRKNDAPEIFGGRAEAALCAMSARAAHHDLPLAKLAHKLDQSVLTRARAKETAFLQEFGSDDAGDEVVSST